MAILDTNEVIRRLNALKGNFPVISTETKIPYNWLLKLAAGDYSKNPDKSGPNSFRIEKLKAHKLIRNFNRKQ